MNVDRKMKVDWKDLGARQSTDDYWKGIRNRCTEQETTKEKGKTYGLFAGILFMRKEQARNKWVVCVPRADTKALLMKYHDGAVHPGINRLQKLLGKLVTWKGMAKEIRGYVRSCRVCRVCKPKTRSLTGPLQSVIPSGVGELVAMDLLGPLVKSFRGLAYVVVLVDLFSKHVELYALRKATSNGCLRKLHNYVELCPEKTFN